jgi:hypothetical protein
MTVSYNDDIFKYFKSLPREECYNSLVYLIEMLVPTEHRLAILDELTKYRMSLDDLTSLKRTLEKRITTQVITKAQEELRVRLDTYEDD